MADLSTPPATPPSGRLVHLDALRGLFLLMMAIDHIPSDLQLVTNHPWGFVSAAEGFVFLAGLMAGMVFTKKLLRAGWSTMVTATRRRAFVIYGWHVGVYLLLLVGVWTVVRLTGQPPGGAPELMAERPVWALVAGVTLIYQPGTLDVLPMYALFFLLLPLLLRALEAGYRRTLLWLSFAGWLATNLWVPQQAWVTGIINTGAFNYGAWQLLFVVGVVFGHAWATGVTLLPRPRFSLMLLLFATGVVLWLNRRGLYSTGWTYELHSWLVNKNNLAPVRLLNTTIVFYLGYLVLARFPQVLRVHSLALLGRHSLAVFSAHVVVALIVNALPWIFVESAEGRFLCTVLMLVALFAAAGLHAAWPRGVRVPQLSPIPHSRRVPLRGIRAT